jgi:DNA polymerase-1
MQRSFGERVAMNASIQGTAADIIKIAMIRTVQELARRNLHAKLILQIHDELLIEAPAAEEEQVKELLKECMIGAAQLSVPLEIDMHAADNWYDLK